MGIAESRGETIGGEVRGGRIKLRSNMYFSYKIHFETE